MAKSENETRLVGARIYRFGRAVQVHLTVDTAEGRKTLVYYPEGGSFGALNEAHIASMLATASKAERGQTA